MADAADLSKSEVVTRWEKAKERASGLAKQIGHGAKPTAITAAGGGGAYFVEKSLKDVNALKGNYRKGGALIIGGHMLKKKNHDLGTGMIFLGGYMLARDYDEQQQRDAASAKAGTSQVAADSPKPSGAVDDFSPAEGLIDVAGLVDMAA